MIEDAVPRLMTDRQDDWVLSAHAPHTDRLYLANGYMSIAPDSAGGALFDSDPTPCYVRGVYTDGPDGIDRLAVVPDWGRLRYGHPAVLEHYRRDLDLRSGILRTWMTVREERGTVEIMQEVLVSRDDQYQAAVRLTVRPTFDGEIELLAGIDASTGGDVRALEVGGNREMLWLLGTVPPYDIGISQALTFEVGDAPADVVIEQHAAFVRFTFVTQTCESFTATQFARLATTLETDDPRALVSLQPQRYDEIRAAHIAAWEHLWETDIDIEGDPEVQRFVRAALFYLWSTVREGDHWSIAPMGLSSNGYNGHIFWDAELWMYPSLLVTHPAMGRSCVAYRERTVPAAHQRATSGGCSGTQFPWEGAYTGAEMTPFWAETRDFQLHITADVAIGQWWYFLATGDTGWLRAHGFPVIRECAEYWVSRVEHNVVSDRYEISDVVCADEYAAHVNNDAFTNASVRKALQIAVRAAEILGEAAPAAWSIIAGKMYLPYDDDAGRHLEFDGYDGRITKQADVELLAYPLEYTLDRDQIQRDLDYYSTVIDPDGPAMSFSVYSIISAQLGRASAAYQYLKRSYAPNTRLPFWSFSETPSNESFHFCTGIGGALQALLFGFTGLRLREDHIVLGPVLPPKWQALRLRNLFVLGVRMDIEIEPERLTLRRKLTGGDVSMEVAWDREEVTVTWPRTMPRMQARLKDAAGQSVQFPDIGSGETIAIPQGMTTEFRLLLGPVDTEPMLDILVRRPGV